jgi:hypothetical protein
MQLPEHLTVVSVHTWVGVLPGTGHFFAEKAPDEMLAALTTWVCSGRDWPPELMAPARVSRGTSPGTCSACNELDCGRGDQHVGCKRSVQRALNAIIREG